MGNSHSSHFDNKSLVRFARQMSAKRREDFSAQLKSNSFAEAECWRMVVIDVLTHIERTERESKWIERIIAAVYDWDASLDIRWRENVKWFLVNSASKSQEKQASDRGSKWAIPGVCAVNIFNSSSITDFFEGHLRLTSSHGIAYLVKVFIDYFIAEYQNADLGNETTAEKMKKDIIDFSEIAAEALRLYYGNLDILELLHKPENFLSILVRSRVLEDESVNNIYLASLRARRKGLDAAYCRKLQQLRNAPCSAINDETREELVEVMRKTGFPSAVDKLITLCQVRSLRLKLSLIDELRSATLEEIDSIRVGKQPIDLTADDMLTLFIFLTVRARVEQLGCHLEMMQEMVRFEHMESLQAFCLATLQGAVMFLENEDNSGR